MILRSSRWIVAGHQTLDGQVRGTGGGTRPVHAQGEKTAVGKRQATDLQLHGTEEPRSDVENDPLATTRPFLVRVLRLTVVEIQVEPLRAGFRVQTVPDVSEEDGVGRHQARRGRAVPDTPRRSARGLVRRHGREQTLLGLLPGTLQENPLDLLGTAVAATEVLQAWDPEVTTTSQRKPKSATTKRDPHEPVGTLTKLPEQGPESGSRAGGTENDAERFRRKGNFRGATAVHQDRTDAELAKCCHRNVRAPECTLAVGLVDITDSDLD